MSPNSFCGLILNCSRTQAQQQVCADSELQEQLLRRLLLHPNEGRKEFVLQSEHSNGPTNIFPQTE